MSAPQALTFQHEAPGGDLEADFIASELLLAAHAHGERSITGRGGEVLLLTECALMYSKVMHCLHALPVSEKRSKSIYASCSQPVPGGSR